MFAPSSATKAIGEQMAIFENHLEIKKFGKIVSIMDTSLYSVVTKQGEILCTHYRLSLSVNAM